MDPPYQGTSLNGGFKYLENINHDDFLISLFRLNQRKVPYILSYDGRTEERTYGAELPIELNLHKIEIDAGRSSIATLHSRNERTFEALYLSESLVASINLLAENEQVNVKVPNLFDIA